VVVSHRALAPSRTAAVAAGRRAVRVTSRPQQQQQPGQPGRASR